MMAVGAGSTGDIVVGSDLSGANRSVNEGVSWDAIGYTMDDQDCDDTNPDINPLAAEIRDNLIDENCDGEILILGINIHAQNNGNQVFPNPFNQLLTIKYASNKAIQIELINAFGQMLLKTHSPS